MSKAVCRTICGTSSMTVCAFSGSFKIMALVPVIITKLMNKIN